MIDPSNQPLRVELGGEVRVLYLDLNAFAAFERETGKFFLDFLARLREAVEKSVAAAKAQNLPEGHFDIGAVMQQVSLSDIRAMIWACCIEYDRSDNPRWPLTIGQVGRLLTLETLPKLTRQLMVSGQENLPTKEELKKSSFGEPSPTVPKDNGKESVQPNGGDIFGPSDAEILDSLKTN